jgi:AcrR family transcriptional regulator
MGIRPPSLYVYFPSKHALYGALFKRGWELLLDDMRAYAAQQPPDDDLVSALTRFGQRFARWSVEHAAYAQLLFWRPVPGFQPSEQAYQPAIDAYEVGHRQFEELYRAGEIRRDADIAAMHRQWTVIISGVISQQLSNAPDEPFASGRFTTALPGLAAMFATHYGNPVRARAS